MDYSHAYYPGKIDYNRSGRRNCRAEFTWTLRDGRFAMQAGVWNPRGTDLYCAGQCVAEVAAYFPNDAKVQRMLAVWERWHLNDMKAGSPAQEKWLEFHREESNAHRLNHFRWASDAMTADGINPDPNYMHDGAHYRYGSAWLTVPLPPEIIAEIESWSVA